MARYKRPEPSRADKDELDFLADVVCDLLKIDPENGAVQTDPTNLRLSLSLDTARRLMALIPEKKQP